MHMQIKLDSVDTSEQLSQQQLSADLWLKRWDGWQLRRWCDPQLICVITCMSGTDCAGDGTSEQCIVSITTILFKWEWVYNQQVWAFIGKVQCASCFGFKGALFVPSESHTAFPINLFSTINWTKRVKNKKLKAKEDRELGDRGCVLCPWCSETTIK